MTKDPSLRQRAAKVWVFLALLGAVQVAAAAPAGSTFVLPWVAPTRGAALQSSDLYLLNPGPDTMVITMVFRRRGTPEDNPPRPTARVAPGATLHLSDLLQVFKRQNVSGYVVATVDGDVAPVITSLNTTFSSRGKRLGEAVAAVNTEAAGPGESHYLVGARQDSSFATTIWLFNPSDGTASCDLAFLALDGSELGSLPGVELGPGSSREFAPNQLPLPAGTRTGPFTVRVTVNAGEVFSSAQVVDRATNDAVFLQGQRR